MWTGDLAMKKNLSLLLLSLAIALPLAAESPAELFQKAKEQVKSARWKEALTTLDALDAAIQDPSFEPQRKQVAPALAFYRAVAMSNLDRTADAQAQFQIYLTATPNASLDRAMYTKKTMDAFENARKTMARPDEPIPGMPSLAASYRDFRPPDSSVTDPPGERWADGPVKVLLTADDRREWAGLMDSASRSEFITKFWAGRDSKPETPENEFRQEFEKRVAFADAHLTQDETRGSLTDRGLVFLLLGPPTYVGRRPIASGEDTSDPQGMSSVGRHDADVALGNAMVNGPKSLTSGSASSIVDRNSGAGKSMTESNWREVWHYRRELLPGGVPYQQVDFEFITRQGYGKNVLQRNPPALTTLEAARQKARPAPGRAS
jgi:GWxTD domain-containing protein